MEGMATLGSSLVVPSVQDLAASFEINMTMSDIPTRYIRPEAEADDPVADESDFNLPVIDLQRAKLSCEESDKIGLACEEWGFFQLINHGVPVELLERMKADSAEFYKLPLEEKQAFAKLTTCVDGYGKSFVVSEEQKLDWGDALSLTTCPHSARQIKFWPTQPPTFRDTMDKYSSAVKGVANCLLRLIAENLGVDPDMMMMNKFRDEDMQQLVAVNYYPPCPHQAAERVIGFSPHSDIIALTILLQANNVPGLQVRKNGQWILVKPLPDAFVVNIGDIIEIFSNGKYKSIEHRAMVNPEKERISVAAFHGPHLDCTVRPLPEVVKGGVENYKACSFKDYMIARLAEKVSGKNPVEKMKIFNN